jgi:hypothetical protein
MHMTVLNLGASNLYFLFRMLQFVQKENYKFGRIKLEDFVYLALTAMSVPRAFVGLKLSQ